MVERRAPVNSNRVESRAFCARRKRNVFRENGASPVFDTRNNEAASLSLSLERALYRALNQRKFMTTGDENR